MGSTAGSTPDLVNRDSTADTPGVERERKYHLIPILDWKGLVYLATVLDGGAAPCTPATWAGPGHGQGGDLRAHTRPKAARTPGRDRQGDRVVPDRPAQVCHIFRRVPFPIRSATGTSSGSDRISTISAVSMATSVPAPIAIPMSACARAGASLTPSPTIATRRPACCSSTTLAALSSGQDLVDDLVDAQLRRSNPAPSHTAAPTRPGDPGRAQTTIRGDQNRVQRLGQRHVHRVPASTSTMCGAACSTSTASQPRIGSATGRPMSTPDSTPTRQRPASGHGPRASSSAASTSSRPIGDERRRVRPSHSGTLGRAARRVASRRSSAGTLIPSLRGAADQPVVHLVIEISDLHGLGHVSITMRPRIATCVDASHPRATGLSPTAGRAIDPRGHPHVLSSGAQFPSLPGVTLVP